MLKIKELQIPGYEKVLEAEDPSVHLHSFIAVHNTSLGPALGGLRMHTYAHPEAALEDVLRLSKAMTYKSALAEDGLGGGKSVIIGNPHKDKTGELLKAFAHVVDRLKGNYIVAEDVGTTMEDMLALKAHTPYICALPTESSSGDPSRFTAWGVFRGMLAVVKKLFHSHSLKNRRIAIQGLGAVGSKLAQLLFWEGADLIVCDIDENQLKEVSRLYGAEIVSEEDFFNTPCDILAPCALGGVLNEHTIPLLNCKAIAGSANNQLHTLENDFELFRRGILYCPDYVINAGGILNAAGEFDEGGYDPKKVRVRVLHIYDTLRTIFQRSEQDGLPTGVIADSLAEYKLLHGIGKRKNPIVFK